MKTELTIEKSAKLIELGVDPKLASKCDAVMRMGVGVRGIIKRPDYKPIFTLTDILAILPKQIGVSGFQIQYKPESKRWWVGYRVFCLKSASELIDALYQLLIWDIENGYVKLKNKDK